MRIARAGRVLGAAIAVLAASPAAAGMRRAKLPVSVTVVRRAEIALPSRGGHDRSALRGAEGVPILFVDGAPPSLVIAPRRSERARVTPGRRAEPWRT
jgi:hypothetical protein